MTGWRNEIIADSRYEWDIDFANNSNCSFLKSTNMMSPTTEPFVRLPSAAPQKRGSRPCGMHRRSTINACMGQALPARLKFGCPLAVMMMTLALRRKPSTRFANEDDDEQFTVLVGLIKRLDPFVREQRGTRLHNHLCSNRLQ